MKEIFRLSLWVMRRRLHSAWGITAVVSLGVLSAVILLVATALYSDVLAEAGVRHSLYSQPQTSLHAQVLVHNRPLNPEDYAELRGAAEEVVERRIGHLATEVQRLGRTQAGMAATTNAEAKPPPFGSPSGRPFFLTGFVEHSRLLDGRWPRNAGNSGPSGVELEAVVGDRVANDFGYTVGTRLYITPYRAAPDERIVLNIVGIAAPIDPRDDFWLSGPTYFSVQTVGEMLVLPAYVAEQDFLQVLGQRFPIAVGDFGFNVFVDPSVITAGDVDATKDALAGLETDLNKLYPRTLVLSRLDLTLEEFKRDLALARVPVFVFASLVVAVVLYFLVLISGILGRNQATELALLLTRGANTAQVCGVLLLAEVGLALVSVGVGPLLAWLIVRFLLLPTFGDLDGGAVTVSLSWQTYWMGAIAAVLSLLVLSVSLAGRARRGMADALATRSRPPEVSFFHRYYLDLVVLVVLGIVWWQFQQRDGFVSRAVASRGLDVDPTLILGPVLGLLAAALLLMRFLPLAVRLLVWVCMRSGPGWSAFSLARLARDPVLPSSLSVLLMLAAALGVFGATFQSSLSRSQSDQAMYRVGGDVTISGPGVGPELAEDLLAIRGVQGASPVLRESVTLVEGHTGVPAALIAADPQVIKQAVWFREDFASSSLVDLADRITARENAAEEADFGIPLPSGARRIGVWMETGELVDWEFQADINLWAKLVDSRGRSRNVSLGGFGGLSGAPVAGWRFFEGEIPEGFIVDGQDRSLAAIFLTTSTFHMVSAASISFDDFTAFGEGLPEEGFVVSGFEDSARWLPLGIAGGAPDRIEVAPQWARTGSSGVRFSWTEQLGGDSRGIHLSPVSLPIPAIGGAGLYEGQTVRIRHGLASIPVVIVGTSELFPTVTNFRRPFLLIDIDAYRSYLRVLPPGTGDTSREEVWLSIDPARDRGEVIDEVVEELPALAAIRDREWEAERASRDPLAGGGWNGLTGLSIAGIGVAVAAALLLHSAASIQMTRVDTAIARAIGMSRRQMYLALAAEKWLTGGVAIAAGAAIGYWPGLELVQLLDVTHSSGASVPPMIPAVNFPLLGAVLASLAGAVMASVLLGAFLSSKASPVDVLRESS